MKPGYGVSCPSRPEIIRSWRYQFSRWNYVLTLVLVLTLSGCVPNQKKYEAEVHAHIRVGMPQTEAIDQFHNMQMTCEKVSFLKGQVPPASGEGIWFVCRRSVHKLYPCVQRVWTLAGNDGLLKDMSIEQTMCAGL